ncbi:MAG TPA: hypothetical protein VD766_08720 [Solirubrobacterales bacterium]|nr:hypothetical protein [Solirubrobacterales bacterium]
MTAEGAVILTLTAVHLAIAFACTCRARGPGGRGVPYAGSAGSGEPCGSRAHALWATTYAEHAQEKVLRELEARDRPAELCTVAGGPQGGL